MSEQLKFIVQELNKEPFNKRLNLISFDAFRPDQLLQALNDVFAELDPKMKADVRSEDPEQLAMKNLAFLRILKYKPPPDIPLTHAIRIVVRSGSFRQGLVSGAKDVVLPLLEWTLRGLPELRKRAYLGRFLVRVELPPELDGDVDLQALYAQYEVAMEQFKEAHKMSEALKASGLNTQELRRDISQMEQEREQLNKKIAKLRRKVETQRNKDVLLQLAKNLREEQDRAETLAQQRNSLRDALNHCEQKINRLTQQLRDLQHSGAGATPEGLMKKLEEEVRANGYLVRDKLPKEIAACQNAIRDLQKVAAEPAMGQNELNRLKAKVQAENQEINALYEQKMRSQEQADDKLTLFRQQAAVIARKKDAAAETLNELRLQVSQLEAQLQEKQSLVAGGEQVLKGDEFKKYVNALRGKSSQYKQQRQELAELRAETGVLARTQEILVQKERDLTHSLEALEEKHGVRGYHRLQGALENLSGNKATLDETKMATLEDMSAMVTNLNKRIAERKGRLAPAIKDLRPLRKSYQDVTMEYDKKKAAYDACAAGLESSMTSLEQEVSSLRSELNSEESKLNFLQHSLRIHEVQLNFLKARGVLGNPAADAGSNGQTSLRAQLSHEIAEQEKRGKALRERQKELREKQSSLRAQTEQWTHLQALLRAKMAAVTSSTPWHQGAPPLPPGSTAAHTDTTSRDWLVL
ncbi:intraflagellar transport protein 81 homolog [Dermacentor andersoni]|uniref:intraflagellar transport protein 81 homolog n=1 Tax=Dermacentor andersoni TaxID=34620 RepID=UPI0021558B23|nr:intraflagellar transport protein 81 homolog [Dermacentor andersoni]